MAVEIPLIASSINIATSVSFNVNFFIIVLSLPVRRLTIVPLISFFANCTYELCKEHEESLRSGVDGFAK